MDTPADPVRSWLAQLGVGALGLHEYVRDLPLPTLRILDLARALSLEPDVLLLDEMTAALPADLTERVLEVVGAQRLAGRSVTCISHRLIENSPSCVTAPRCSATARRWGSWT